MSKEEHLKYIASVVRALVTSRKPPVELKYVLKDYFDVEGTTLPYKKLGYNSPLSLLQATGEFIWRKFDGEIYIFANFSEKTAHIESMIKNQKKGKIGSLKFPRPLSRKPGGLPHKSYNLHNHYSRGGGSGHHLALKSYHKLSTNLGRWPSSSVPSYPSARNTGAPSYSRSISNSNYIAERREPPNSRSISNSNFITEKREVPTENYLLAATVKELEYKNAKLKLLHEKYGILKLEAKKLKENYIFKEFKKDEEKEQNEQNYNLNQRASFGSGTSEMQSSPSSVAKSPLEQEQKLQLSNHDVGYPTNNNTNQYNSNNNNTNNYTNNNNNKYFDLRDKLTDKYKRMEEEKKQNQEGVVQQQNQNQLTSKNKVEEIGNKSAKNININTNTNTNTYKAMRPILGQTSKTSPPSSAASTPFPLSTTHNKNEMNTQKQKQQLQQQQKQQKSSPHYIMGSTNGHGHGRGQETKSSASESLSPLLPTPPPHSNDKTKAKPSVLNKDNNDGSIAVQPTSVQDRLKIKRISIMTPPSTPDQHRHTKMYSDIYSKAVIQESYTQIENNKATKISYTPFQFEPSDAVNSLEKYCRARGFREPEYKYFQTKGRFHCHVKISDQIYSSYPIELLDRKSAKLRTAEIAVEKLQDSESRNFLPKCHFSEKQFEIEIFEKLKQHPNGIITKDMSVWFEKTFQQQMPKNWWSVLLNSSKFKMESSCLTENSIVYAITDLNDIDETPNNTLSDVIVTPPDTPLIPSSMPPTIIESKSPLPPIKLPWPSLEWGLLTTFCRSTTEVWGRLFGEIYSDAFNEMNIDLQKLIKNQELMNPVKTVEKDELYIAAHATHGWQRVILEDLDKKKGMCNCFFVDFGESVAIPLGELYQCTSHFRRLPAQAICLTLKGLHEFVNHPYAYRVLYATLIDTPLIASIKTLQEVYESTGGTVQGYLDTDDITRHGCIQAVLFDTSSPDDDININDVLIEQMNDIPPPKLKADLKSNPVLVTHVGDNGELYVIIPNENMSYVQHLISEIVGSKFQRDQHRVIYSDLNPDTIFLICDNISNPRGETTWYRGMLTEKPQNPEDEAFDIYYVDYGRIHSTHISKIFRLDLLSSVLDKFPQQAIRVCLHDVPPMTITTVARLRGLLPPNTDALVKVNGIEKDDGNYEIPMVTLFTLGQTGAYCAVNDTLRIEYEFESSKQPVEMPSSNINCLDSSRSGGILVRSDSHSSSQSVCSSNNSVIELTHSLQHLSVSNKAYMLKPIKDFEAIPALNAYFEIRVSYSANPMLFVVQPYKEYCQLVRLMQELQEYCDNCKDYVPTDSIILGEAYATKNKDGYYHRAIALKNFGETVSVKYVDFGDEAAVRSTQLKVLPVKLRQLPKMAVNAKLYGIKSINDEWSVDDCGRFRELTLGKKLIAIVHKVSYPDMDAQKAALLTLELFDTTTSVDIRIHELLIEEKRGLLDNKA